MLGIRKDEPSQSEGRRWIGPAPWIETSLPGPIATAIIQRQDRHRMVCARCDYPLVVQRAAGSVIEDVDGNRFLDFAAGVGAGTTGHCPRSVVAAVEAQARSLLHPCESACDSPPAVELTERLASITPGDGPHRVFLTNGAMGAMEAGVALCRSYLKRKRVIAVCGSTPSRLAGSRFSAHVKATPLEGLGSLVPQVTHVPYGELETLESKLCKHGSASTSVAAVIVETFPWEDGRGVSDGSFLSELRKLCDAHGALLVCDEIQSGIGRTGRWFAFEHFDVQPDMILLAEGLAGGMPLGAVIARGEIVDQNPDALHYLGGGNPVCCAAALATLDLVESTHMENAAKLGEHLLTRLGEMAAKRGVIANPRGLGVMVGIDVVHRKGGRADPKQRQRILRDAFERGLILSGCGEAGIRFCPPQCINDTQLEVGLKAFDEVLALLS